MAPAFGIRNARWRTWVRGRTPSVLYYRVGLRVPKVRDCGHHEWYNADNVNERCYHCEAERPREQVL